MDYYTIIEIKNVYPKFDYGTVLNLVYNMKLEYLNEQFEPATILENMALFKIECWKLANTISGEHKFFG